MNRRGLGCLSGTGIIAGLIAVFSIVGYGFASGGVMFSPGRLNSQPGEPLSGYVSHAEIDGNCNACHVAPWDTATMDDRCLVCHANVAEDLNDLDTIHGRLEQRDPNAACRDCHPEHNGPMASLTVIESWKFPHEVTGYWLNGHQFKAEDEPFLCRDCHTIDVTRFDPLNCKECHSQRDAAFMTDHQKAFGESCLNCHDGLDSYGDNFDHNLFHFALNGKHADILCSQCHVDSHTIIELQATKTDCASCHQADDPHEAGLGTDCASCHTVDGWKPAHFDHNRSAFKLDTGHANVACANCHKDLLFKGTPMECFACHKEDDPHKGELGADCASCHKPTTWKDVAFDHSRAAFALTGKHVGVACANCHKDLLFKDAPTNCYSCHSAADAHSGKLGTDCAKCHTVDGWLPAHFDHNLSSFKLTGLHVNVPCASCHKNKEYKGTPTDCFSCHAAKDAHAGQFGTICSQCHVTSGWKNVVFDHSKTSFQLTGLHTNVQCKSCHVNGVFKGTPKNCYACHAGKDKHNGQFGTDCSSCHVTSGWKNVTFDHSKTAFPLTGSHMKAACLSCHQNGVYKGTPTNCYACHAGKDKHNGQFGTNCGSCHKPTKWQDVTFDHNNTAFPLSGKHTNVNCNSCHQNGVYKGTPTNCYACHAGKDAHNGQFGTDCGSCHTPSGWGNVTFDHNNTAFPLVGKHTKLSCSKCHSNGVYKGTPTQCIACHTDKHNGENGTDCGACHTPTDWGKVKK